MKGGRRPRVFDISLSSSLKFHHLSALDVSVFFKAFSGEFNSSVPISNPFLFLFLFLLRTQTPKIRSFLYYLNDKGAEEEEGKNIVGDSATDCFPSMI